MSNRKNKERPKDPSAFEQVTAELEALKLQQIMYALKDGKPVFVYLEALRSPESTGERRVSKIRMKNGKLQCKLADFDAESWHWWDTTVADLWTDKQRSKRGKKTRT